MRAWIVILWALGTGPVVAGLLQAPSAAWVAMLGYHAGCVLAARVGRGRLGARPRRGRFVALALVSAAAVALLGLLAHETGLQPHASPQWAHWGLAPPDDRWLLLYYMIVNPWIEEWFWRGTLLGGPVRRVLGSFWGRTLAVVGFWPLHAVVLVQSFGLVQGGFLSLACLVAGALWTGMRERQGDAWDAVASHQGADAAVVWLYWAFLRGAGA